MPLFVPKIESDASGNRWTFLELKDEKKALFIGLSGRFWIFWDV
jgi:hypothetical protein